MAYEFKLPDLGEGLTEGEIARWLVSEGQEIGEDDPLVEIQTDKTTVEIPSPAAGTVTSILVEEGKVVPVGTVLVVIGSDSGDGAPRVERSAPPSRSRRPPRKDARHRSCARSRRSSASTWTRSRAPARRGASPRKTSAARPRRERDGASLCAVCGA